MSRADTMKSEATRTTLDDVATDRREPHRTQAASWDPFEVWLTRIKQPRDRAAKLALTGEPTGGADSGD